MKCSFRTLHLASSAASGVPQPASTPARPALQRQAELVDQVVRVGDAAGDEERVHLLLEELVALEDVAEVCGSERLSIRRLETAQPRRGYEAHGSRCRRSHAPKMGNPSERATSSCKCRSWWTRLCAVAVSKTGRRKGVGGEARREAHTVRAKVSQLQQLKSAAKASQRTIRDILRPRNRIIRTMQLAEDEPGAREALPDVVDGMQHAFLPPGELFGR